MERARRAAHGLDKRGELHTPSTSMYVFYVEGEGFGRTLALVLQLSHVRLEGFVRTLLFGGSILHTYTHIICTSERERKFYFYLVFFLESDAHASLPPYKPLPLDATTDNYLCTHVVVLKRGNMFEH